MSSYARVRGVNSHVTRLYISHASAIVFISFSTDQQYITAGGPRGNQ